ncbi:MAG: CopD family protein [Mesorhizobium sp.]
MIVWLKLLHIAAVCVWMAGLVSLPGLYVQRAGVREGERLYLLQRTVRFAFLKLMSPAAFLAITSGAALIFATGVFMPWLSAKLALVAMLVLLHTLTGLVIIRLFEEGEVYPVWRFVAVTAVTVVLIVAVLALVLAKPELDWRGLVPVVLTEPGGLRRLVEDLSPWPIP